MVFVQYDEFKNGFWPLSLVIFWNMFSRAFFIIGLIMVLMPTFTLRLYGIHALLGSHFWQPLARLSYSAYLVHLLVLFWYYGSSRTGMFVYPTTTFINFFACTMIALSLIHI